MTTYRHRVMFGARADQSTSGTANEEWLRRLGYIVFDKTHTGGELLQIWNGTLAYPAGHPETFNFIRRRFLHVASNRQYFMSMASMEDGNWGRVADRIVNAPLTNMRYVRLVTIDGHEFRVTADHNVAALDPFVGQIMESSEIIAAAGMVYLT